MICDFAETYQIFDYRAIPARLVAKLAVGLKNSSRIKIKVSGLLVAPDTFLLASIFDVVNLLLWSRTEDGEKGRNRPAKISANLTNGFKTEKSNSHETLIFDSAEEYEAARGNLLTGGINKWQQN